MEQVPHKEKLEFGIQVSLLVVAERRTQQVAIIGVMLRWRAMTNWKKGEQLVINFLTSNGYEVEDVSCDSQYWDIDTDIIATNSATGGRATIEIKYDGRINKTGNLYIETFNPRSKGKKGFFYFTKADFLYYIDAITDKCYILKLSVLRDYIKKNDSFLKIGGTSDGSKGFLLPLSKAPIFKEVQLS